MLQSLMVFPNNNDFFQVSAAMLDDNVAKLMNTDEIDNYLTSASTSPIQDYLMAPSNAYHPQQQNQRQHQLQFSSAITATTMPPMVPHSAPSSPSYPIIKSEDVQQQQHNMEYIMFPSTFDHTASSAPSQGHHIVPSQHSPQMQQQQQRMMPFENVSLIQQRQHHQQQQQQHAQQLRLQHQQRAYEQQQYQQQIMYEPSHSHSTAPSMSMTIPVTSSVLTAIAGPTTTVTTTSAPFDLSFQRQQQSSYTPAAHPAAPKRKREESGQVQLLPRQTSPQLTIESSPATSAAAVTANHNVNVLENSPSLTKTSAATASPCSGRLSTSSRLDKVKTTRSTKITKSSFSSTSSSSSATEMITSTAAESKAAAAVRAPKKTPAKKANNTTAAAASESRESSQQPENGSDALASHLPNSTGNITHPRRAAQNRAAQRTFRNRRKAYIKELEHKVQDMDRTRELMESIHLENQEVWRRLQILEALASQSGLQVPAFPAMTPALLNSNNNAMSSNGVMPMGSSNDDEDEDEDDDMSDAYTQQHAQ
ncbi:hypothetical protein BGZ67_007996 [Mortierella alpina]|nr:hypothetical protein BGZ67_007996 [Mortierella alpina]